MKIKKLPKSKDIYFKINILIYMRKLWELFIKIINIKKDYKKN